MAAALDPRKEEDRDFLVMILNNDINGNGTRPRDDPYAKHETFDQPFAVIHARDLVCPCCERLGGGVPLTVGTFIACIDALEHDYDYVFDYDSMKCELGTYAHQGAYIITFEVKSF